jgi:hypothetical protein
MKPGCRKGRFTKANASRLGKLGAKAREEKRLQRASGGYAELEPQRVPQGQHLGVLTWHAADGTVRRWIVKQGPRSNNIGILPRIFRATPFLRFMGWDTFLTGLRAKLSTPKRILK